MLETATVFESEQAYEAECKQQLTSAQARFAKLEQSTVEPTVRDLLDPLNILWINIDRGMNWAGLYSRVHPEAAVRAIAEKYEQAFSRLVTEIGLSRPLFEALQNIKVSDADPTTQRFVAHTLRDFRRAGVDRDAATRTRIRELRDELVKIGQAFSRNTREDVRTLTVRPEELAGLPQDYIDAHPPSGNGRITLTTDYPDYLPFMTYAHSDERRLDFYRLFRQRGYPKNRVVLETLLAKRFELAQLLGYPDWATYITEDKMVKTPEKAQAFIDEVAALGEDRSKRDYQALLQWLQQQQPDAEVVGDWQKSYLEEDLKRHRYHVDSQQLRTYFAFAKVKEGVLATMAELFGVEFQPRALETWHASVEAYEVLDGDTVIGRFFLDMHPRPNKYKHAAAFPLRSGVDGHQLPEAALVCNFPGGPGDEDGLLEHSQVETFFHEFGHLLHHLFGGKARWLSQSGFNTEWDFVEVPSQLLEEWAWDPNTLRRFATNAEGEPLPVAMIEAARQARDFGKGLWVGHQIFYAALSLAYYRGNPAEIDTTGLLCRLQERYSPFGYVDDTYFQYSFGHLDGYSAMYYTYMWSLVIAKDLFGRFEEEGLSNPKVAHAYRETVLAPGGSVDADDMIARFLGRSYGLERFSEWLHR